MGDSNMGVIPCSPRPREIAQLHTAPQPSTGRKRPAKEDSADIERMCTTPPPERPSQHVCQSTGIVPLQIAGPQSEDRLLYDAELTVGNWSIAVASFNCYVCNSYERTSTCDQQPRDCWHLVQLMVPALCGSPETANTYLECITVHTGGAMNSL